MVMGIHKSVGIVFTFLASNLFRICLEEMDLIRVVLEMEVKRVLGLTKQLGSFVMLIGPWINTSW